MEQQNKYLVQEGMFTHFSTFFPFRNSIGYVVTDNFRPIAGYGNHSVNVTLKLEGSGT